VTDAIVGLAVRHRLDERLVAQAPMLPSQPYRGPTGG